MALTERLIGLEFPRLDIHAFISAMGEIERGKMTQQQASVAFGLSPAEQAEALDYIAAVKTPQECYPLAGRVTLTNIGTTYDANLESQSLPFCYAQCAGITRLDMDVRVRKVGTGTQHWQLWDDTNSVEALGEATLTSGSLSDAGAAADRTLIGSRIFAGPLASGVRKLRLRARSTNGADDPMFLNAAVLVFRVNTITADMLHQVLLMANHCVAHNVPPLQTAAAVKTRIGL